MLCVLQSMSIFLEFDFVEKSVSLSREQDPIDASPHLAEGIDFCTCEFYKNHGNRLALTSSYPRQGCADGNRSLKC